MPVLCLQKVNITASFARDNATKLEYKKSILRQQFSAERPNQRLVSDVICFKLGGHYSYICVAIGLFSHRVIAYKIRKKQHTTLTATFKMAYEDPEPLSELIFHSGYGSQYLSHRFQQFLREHHTKQPFSHLGKPYDNTVAETFFASLKKKSSTERTFLPIERLKPVLLHISSFIIPIVH